MKINLGHGVAPSVSGGLIHSLSANFMQILCARNPRCWAGLTNERSSSLALQPEVGSKYCSFVMSELAIGHDKPRYTMNTGRNYFLTIEITSSSSSTCVNPTRSIDQRFPKTEHLRGLCRTDLPHTNACLKFLTISLCYS